MKLEDQLFHWFFYPFLIGLILSASIIITSSVIFTGNFLDRGTANNLISLEKNYSKVNLNSVNIIISSYLLKVQSSLNELIHYYQNLANKIKDNNSISTEDINETFFKSASDLINNNKSFLKENKDKDILKFMSFWVIDSGINLNNISDINTKKQMKVFANMTQNIYSTFSSVNLTASDFYFYFDSTELFICTPVDYFYNADFFDIVMNFQNYVWCTDENGKIYLAYKAKCRSFYINSQKAKSDVFDYNYNDYKNRSIFVTEYYYQAGGNAGNVYSMCIQFTDPISINNAYACADINQTGLLFNLDNINNKLNGYFFINPVGFNKAFYFPQMPEEPLTTSESIFNWNETFYLNEKTYFNNHIQKLMTSNYIKYIKDSIFDEVFINGINSESQYFSVNGELFNFSIYPIVLENINGNKEHIMNIIYIYNYNMFYNRLTFDTDIGIKLLLEAIIFIVFGTGLLYLIVLSLNILSKYIVIPIKNVNYMLKGINIGGKNRLDYLDFLKKKQDENIELLEKIYLSEEKNKKKENNETDNNNANNENTNLLEENGKDDNGMNKEENMEGNDPNNQNDTEYNDELINSKVDYNQKFDEESEFIEKEATFYDFDEQLLQYRPLEIDRLVKSLIDLKGALNLTSSDQPVDQIIQYSNSEDIFNNFKNKEGATICQSNIGNLESKLSKYENAIYHLATSLLDNKLKKFLSKNLSDELDESDTLLDKITQSYNKTKKKEKMNVLIQKQLNNSKDNFSQKIIGILINSRYTRLIHVYYKFFSIIQKSNSEALSGQFMNTSFHKINYYHKILIQFIYLSFVKNDLVKIGESILDYIEFLLKFKLKISKDNEYLLNINNKDRPELKRKQKYKRYIYDKIVNWINLFDDYVSHVRDNTSLGDDKSIIESFSHTINSANSEFDSGSQSVFLFRVNVQRGEFIKGKFALLCNNYNDALYNFIRSAKKNSIVLDGLIKKKALKRIYKILITLFKKYDNYGIIRDQMQSKINEYEKTKMRSYNKKYSHNYNYQNQNEDIKDKKNRYTFKQEMDKINTEIITALNECNAKQAKDILIIIDFNKYNQELNNAINTDKIDSFIDQTKTILDDYLSNSDRLCVFIYTNQYQIICPLIGKKEIDFNSFSKDLFYYKKSILNEKEESEEYTQEEMNENDLQNETQKFGMKLENGSNFSDSGSNDSVKNGGKQFKIKDVIKGLIETINYSKNYLKMKEIGKNEKYVILFTDLFNNYKMSDDNIYKSFENLEEEKDIIFLLVGKNKSKDFLKDKEINIEDDMEEKKMKRIINKKFGERSEIIDFENMKKIKTILSSNNVIKDEILFPNEIYK